MTMLTPAAEMTRVGRQKAARKRKAEAMTPEELQAHYQTDAAYKKLLNGEEGVNLLNYFGGVVTTEHMEEWTDFAIDVARGLLREQGLTDAAFHQFEDVANYCRGITYNVMRDDRMQKGLEIEFHFDVEAWLEDDTRQTLDRFELHAPRRVSFQLTGDQVKLLDDLFALHGNTVAGR